MSDDSVTSPWVQFVELRRSARLRARLTSSVPSPERSDEPVNGVCYEDLWDSASEEFEDDRDDDYATNSDACSEVSDTDKRNYTPKEVSSRRRRRNKRGCTLQQDTGSSHLSDATAGAEIIVPAISEHGSPDRLEQHLGQPRGKKRSTTCQKSRRKRRESYLGSRRRRTCIKRRPPPVTAKARYEAVRIPLSKLLSVQLTSTVVDHSDLCPLSYYRTVNGLIFRGLSMSDAATNSETTVQELYVPTTSILGEPLHRNVAEVFKIDTTTMPYTLSGHHFRGPLVIVQVVNEQNDEAGNTNSIGVADIHICRYHYCLRAHTFTKATKATANEASLKIFGYPRVLDLFCGAGGFSTAAEINGFEIVAGVDSNEDAISAFEANHPDALAIHQSVEAFLDGGKHQDLGRIDVIIAGPPCPGFSSANPMAAQDFEGRSLLLQVSRAVHMYQPKAVIVENVTGILQRTGSPYFHALLTDFLEAGYETSWTVLSAPTFGSCQDRSRVFVVATRGIRLPSQPTKNYRRNAARAVGTVLDSIPMDAANHGPFESGNLSPASQATCVLDRNSLCDTVRTKPSSRWSSYINYNDSDAYRRLTPREVACIQGFDLEFQLDGDWRAAFRQAANAVPLELGDAVMDVIAESFEGMGTERGPFGVPLPARDSESAVKYENELEDEPPSEKPLTTTVTIPQLSEVISYEEEWISVVDSALRVRPSPHTYPCALKDEDQSSLPTPMYSREEFLLEQEKYLDGTFKSTVQKEERLLICSCCHRLRAVMDFGPRPYSRKYPICAKCRQYHDAGRFDDIPDEWVHPLPLDEISDDDIESLLKYEDIE